MNTSASRTRRIRPFQMATVVLLAGAAVLSTSSLRAVEIAIASYEPGEAELVVTPGGADAGLNVSVVEGGTNGAPAATDGVYVLRLDFSGEDGKVEIKHTWSAPAYSLAAAVELRADIYIANPNALPALMGVWSPNWSPPDAWQPADAEPDTSGAWTTVAFNVATRDQVDLDTIAALVFEDMPSSTGTIYVDNLRLSAPEIAVDAPTGVAANAYAAENRLIWKGISAAGMQGYRVYRAISATGPFTQVSADFVTGTTYTDTVGTGSPEYFYTVTAMVQGSESDPSEVASALYNGMTDEVMLDLMQWASFGYFWYGGHPVCGMAREGIGTGHWTDTVTTGGTGMGIASIVVGAERGFVTRAEAAERIRLILIFLEDVAERYHGAWSHHLNGVTGETIAFAGAEDNGGDLVETAFLVEGMLIARQYFDDPIDPVETEIRARATRLWEGVEWDWYRQYPGSDWLYWHWSPDYGFALNHPIGGYDEAMIAYILAVASPTHPMPASCYYGGWANSSSYFNGNSFYGYTVWAGPDYGGPLFWTHYSNFGFDPRDKRDNFCNYYENARNIALIHQAYAIDNPIGYAGYNGFCWGMTASINPWGYAAQSPTADNGTITPTAALSSMPYSPGPSLAAMRYIYDNYADDLWGLYGFQDAFNPSEGWFAEGWLAIDVGPIAPMIENYRTGLCWDLFMKNPEIEPALKAIGWVLPGDLDGDGDVDAADYATFSGCLAGPNVAIVPATCTAATFAEADFDHDGDVDTDDFADFQRRFDTP